MAGKQKSRGALEGMSPAAVAAMKEDLAAHRTDTGTGDTNMDFPTWLRASRPERYRVYLKVTGQGK